MPCHAVFCHLEACISVFGQEGQLIAQVHQSKLGWVRIGTCSTPGENRPSEEHAVTKLRLEGTEGRIIMTETS